MDAPAPQQMDPLADQRLLQRWLTEIGLYEEARKKFDERGDKIIKRYADKRPVPESNARKMNLLWSNVEVLKPTIYAKVPKADVKRRFKDQDPVGRVASMILERACEYFLDCKDRFDAVMKDARDDYLLVGMGVAWQRYVPHMRTVTPEAVPVFPADGELMLGENDGPGEYLDADGNRYEDATPDDMGGFFVQPEPYEEVEYEEVVDDYVHWKDFGHNAGARTWDEVYAVWRRVFLTRDELVERFGEQVGMQIPLDHTPDGMKEADKQAEQFKKACIYEIWDRSSKRAIWVSKGYPVGPLDVRDDPLRLEQFFPCPKPLFATLTHECLIPIPDYAQYQDQAEEIDIITARIGNLTKALKVRGIYAGSMSEVKRLFQDANELDLIPVENWQQYTSNGGLQNAIQWVPLRDIAEALIRLYDARDRAKTDMYEITGLSDIMRGNTDPNETATAQQIKANAGSIRVREKRAEIQRFARDLIRIKAEIICEHFSPDTIVLVAGVREMPPDDQALVPMALELLKSDKLRDFRVEIETDSTIAMDEQQDRQDRVEFVTAVSGFLQQATPIIQAAPGMAPLMGELLKFAVRGFRAGEQLENVITQAMDAAAQPPAPPPPDPNAQIKAQAEGMKAQADVQRSEIELFKAQVEASTLPLRLQADAATAARDASNMTAGGM